MTGTLDGTLELRVGEQNILTEIDFSARHEIADGGQTITGIPVLAVLEDGVVSTNLVLASIVLDSTSKIVQFKVTVGAAANVSDKYEIKCTTTLSGGAVIVECLGVGIIPC